MTDLDKMKAASQDALNVRALALLDATKAVCGYCAKGESCGHEEIPFKANGEWRHDFIVGSGSNPCAAGPIWDLVENCLKHPTQYNPDSAVSALKAWEHWYSVDSTEFNRDTARDMGLKAIADAERKL